MPLQKVTLSIDIPEGYEATGEYRVPRAGECILTDQGVEPCDAGDLCLSYLIVREKWQPPDFLSDGAWVWKDYSGEFCVSHTTNRDYCAEPKSNVSSEDATYWVPRENGQVAVARLRDLCLLLGVDYVPPPTAKLQVRR